MLNALGKLSSNVPFMMPERLAKTDPFQQIPEAIGSGPFKFVKEEWVPGNKAVFVKNADYVPRKEPPSFASGGKVAKVDRVEWLYIPDTATAVGRAQRRRSRLVRAAAGRPRAGLRRQQGRRRHHRRPARQYGRSALQPHRMPPFNNPKMREAVLNLVDQKDYMEAVAGDQKYWKTCAALFICGTPFETEAGADALLKGPEPRQGQGADRRRPATRARRSCCCRRPTSRSSTPRRW